MTSTIAPNGPPATAAWRHQRGFLDVELSDHGDAANYRTLTVMSAAACPRRLQHHPEGRHRAAVHGRIEVRPSSSVVVGMSLPRADPAPNWIQPVNLLSRARP